jgi:DNA polymerase III epsilon subunit-like protein
MTGTFKTKTRVYTSPEFFTPISGRKSFVDAAVDFRRGLIENSSMAVLNADLAVKAAMGAGLSSSAASIGQSAQDGSPDTDGKKRVNKGGVPGMDEDEEGYRYMPESTWGPDKVLRLFPSREERQSSNKVPNFGFVDKEPMFTPEQFVQQVEQKPKIRMSKYKINTRTGEPIEDTEVEFDRMRFGKTFKLNPDVSNEIDENMSDEESGEIQEKSLGSTLKQRMPGASIAGRAAARFGVIMDELGKMRCPPGTPAANQFTDMTGSNCFGTTPGNIISEAINLAQRLVPENDPMRSSGFTRGIANFLFDMENGIFGNNVWYHADGTRMKHGEWRKFREAGGVAKNERWMVNGVERVHAELDAQDARMADLYAKLGVDVSDASKETNEHLYEAFKKLRESGVITADILGKPTPAQVEAMMVARLKNMDAHWIARTDEEKEILLKIEVQRYRELERAHLEAFLDEVIKNPEHMKSIPVIRMMPTGRDRASYAVTGIDPRTGKPVGSIDIDIPASMAFQDSMLPNLSPDERLRIWAEGGQSDALRAMAVKDFLVNSNSHAGQMMAMVDGGRGLGRHDMKHEIAHSIQAAAIFEHMKRELDARGSLLIPRKDKTPIEINSVDELTASHLMALMINEDYMGIDLETLSNLRSRADVVAFLAGRYIDDVKAGYGDKRRASEIGAELWALRSSGLVFGDDVDAALEYMDDIASGKITIDRDVSDSILTRRIYEDHLDGSRRVREAREARERDAEYRDAAEAEAARLAEEAGSADGEFFDADGRASEERMSAAREAYAQEKRAEVKATKEAAKTMTEEEMIDFLASSTESSDALSELLDAADDAGEEPSWMSVMDRDTLDSQTKAVADEWVKRFTVRRSPEAMEKLQKMIDEKRESRGTLSPEKIEERRYREFMEGATERAKDMDLVELVQHYSDWEELATGEGVDGPERIRRKEMRDMYRDEYVKRRTEGPDSVSKEDARKEFNSKFKEIRKPKTVAEKEKKTRVKPKKFTSHKGKNGAHTFATEERARLMEGATTAEKVAFVEMGSGDTDAINMMIGHDEGMAAARAIQRRNTRLRKNGILPDGLNQHEASIEEQIENFYIPLIELMDKSSLSQTVEMYIDSDDDAAKYVEELLNGGMPVGSGGIGTGTLVTDKTDFSDGKKIIIRVPEGSRALLPDWSYYSESDNGEQKMMIPPSKFHLVEIREDGTVILEVGEQKGTEEILREAVGQIGYSVGDGDRAYREGLQKKVSKIVDRRIAERRKQGMFDPRKNSPIEEERFTTTADTAASGAGFTPDSSPRPPRRATPRRFATNDDDIGTGDFDDDLSPDERRWRMEEMRSRGNDRLSSGAKWGQMPSSNEQLARLLEPSNNDGFNEIYGPPQTREERITQMAEMQSEVMTSLREMFDNVPGAGDSLGLDLTHIDPVLADFIKNSSDEEIYKLVAESAKNLHESFDARPRVRMRQDELDKFAVSGRYGREGSFDTERLSSGLVKKGIKARAKERAIEMISERIGKDEDSKEIAEMFLGTVSALKFGPEAALTRLAIDLGRRGSRDIAERTVQELIDRGKITDEQAKSILSKLDKIAPDGLPEPLKRGVGRAARATTDALDTPENRDRLERAREAAGDAAGRAREAVGEGARNMAERGRERLRKLRERDDAGSLPSASDDVPFGDFDPADAPVDPFSSGRRLDRRVSGSDAGRERIMEGASVTRTRLSSGGAPKKDRPKKPSRPRDPDNGPMTGKFIDIFRGVQSYQEMLDRYNEQEVIFFDYETTGFSPTDDRPVQIGAVKMKGGKVIERFNVFVNPEKELSDWSKENLLNADGKPLTNDWLSGQSSVNEGHQQLIDFFGPDALLGGQYTPFDLGFLEESLKNAGIEWTPAGVIDSKALADELLPRWTADGGDGPFALNPDGTKYATNSLGPLSEYLEVELTAWHTADADSEASAMIVQKILERAAEREDTPKHLLDVDNLPNVVTERKARHKLEMDKYFADMKQYKIDNDAYEASQTGERLSSGETLGGKPEKTVRIDELLADPAMAEELRKRSADVKALSYSEREKRFTDPNDPDAVYVVHYGATTLEGGQLDPSRSRGQVGAGIAGNTRQINDETARYMVSKRDDAKRDLSILEEMKRQIEADGIIDFEAIAATDSRDSLRAGRARMLLGLNRRNLDYERSTITPSDWQSANLDGAIDDQNRVISRLDKVADQLVADDYQYTSTYRASSAQDLFGSYGGRYAENDSTEWGDGAERSPDTGIHIFRVKIGEDATEENAVGETHLVGKHTPIASLVASNDASNKNPALDTWTGWMDMAIEADIKKRSSTTETRLSSGEGPRSKKPKRVKKYKGYTLNEPDNPTTKPGEYPDDVVEAATKHRAEIEKVEAEITKLLIDLAEKNKANMEGLDFRLKALKSLIRKIAAEKDSEHGGDADKAAKAMSDVVRYTMSYEPADYIAGVKDVIAEMQKLGYDLRVKNYWKGDDPYQGINVAVTHPNGTQFELQFHTPQSVADKEKIHLIYDNYRTETDPKKRWIMYNRMVRIANKIGVPVPPDELLEIGIVKEQPFTPR